MDFGLLATIQAAIWLVVGGAFLVVPRQWVAPLGATLGTEATLVARILGGAYLSLAVLDFLGRDTSDPVAQSAIAFANLTANGLACGVHIADLLGVRVLNVRAWGLVALTGVLAALWLLTAL